jgi:hypothetical protein
MRVLAFRGTGLHFQAINTAQVWDLTHLCKLMENENTSKNRGTTRRRARPGIAAASFQV